MSFCARCYFFLLVVISLIPAKNSFAIKSESPEDLILNASQMLENLDKQLGAIKTIREGKGYHINNEEAAVFLEKANLFFDQNVPYASLYWYSKYLHLIQIPSPPIFLHIQKNLFYIYSKTHQYQKSFEAAKKYTASFISAQDQNFVDLEGILRLFYSNLKHSTINKNELNSFISGFATINFPENMKYQMMYLIAKIASQSGLNKVASQWLANASAFSSDIDMFARTKLFQAIIAIRLNKHERAYHILTLAMEKIGEDNVLLPFYQLYLGRLNFALNKPKLAEQYYKAISQESAAYYDRVFELCFLYASVGNWEQAKTEANLYLSSNLAGSRANMTRRLMPFFDIKAGHFEQGSSNLQAGLENIKMLESKLKPFTRTKQYSAYEAFRNLELEVNELISPPILSKKLAKIERNIVHLNEQANSLGANIQYSLHSISKAKITSYNPDLHHHYLQLLTFGNDLLKVGHMLTSAEKEIYSNKLTMADKQELTALWNRRTNMMSEKYKFHRNSNPMRNESVFLEKNALAAKMWNDTQKINAMITASKHMLDIEDNGKKQALEESLEYLISLHLQLNNQVSIIIGRLRELRFRNQANVFSNMPQRIFFAKFSNSLLNEGNLYLPLRSNYQTASAKIRSEKLTAVWNVWKDLSDRLNKNLNSVELQVETNITEVINSLSNLQSDLSTQRAYIERSSNRFTSIAKSSISSLADHYLFKLGQLAARYKKWIADLKWDEYKIIKTSEHEANAIFEAEKKEFENSLFDINNGILESW